MLAFNRLRMTLGMDVLGLLTGSQVYGTPNKHSDIDLVVLMDQATYFLLQPLADVVVEFPTNTDSGEDMLLPSLRFGRLNLIICTDDESFAKWMQGTKELIEVAPVSRDEAVAYFRKVRERA